MWIFLIYSLLGVHWAYQMCKIIFIIKFRKFSDIISLNNFFLNHTLCPFFMGLWWRRCYTCWYCPIGPWGPVHFHSFFSVVQIGLFLFFYRRVYWFFPLPFHSAIRTIHWGFYFSYCIFQFYNFHLTLSSISSLCLCLFSYVWNILKMLFGTFLLWVL